MKKLQNAVKSVSRTCLALPTWTLWYFSSLYLETIFVLLSGVFFSSWLKHYFLRQAFPGLLSKNKVFTPVLVFFFFISYWNCFTHCHAQQLAQSYSGSAALFVAWVNENAVIASENDFWYLEQLCPVDFLWWWKCFIFVLSNRAAPPICGSWALEMWRIKLKN